MIADDLGISDRPYTSVFGGDVYTLHIGPSGYLDAVSAGQRSTFIHELTHVWQGQHSVISFSYMLRSVFAQYKSYGRGQPDAYEYKVGKDWSDYNVEQQAHIVEDWYTGGKQPADPLYQYIRSNILPGKD